MKIALLADVHSNLEALRACLTHAARQGVERHVFLGDLVGYGADPVACLELIADRVADGALAVRGNHDDAVLSGRCESMHFIARDAVYWTRRQLGESQRRFLASLPLSARQDDLLFVHAEPESPQDFGYVTDAARAARALAATNARVVLAGHVHEAMLYYTLADASTTVFHPTPGTPVPLLNSRQWFAIVGAVGQPRDDNPAAGYAILDTDRNSLNFLRVPYDVDTAARKILAAGLPESLALRLAHGH